MIVNLLIGFVTMKVCLILQLLLLIGALRYYRGHERYVLSPSTIQTIAVLTMVMGILVVGNLGQIAVWALIFRAMGEFPNFADAYYHSAVNFATLGYGDVVMSEENRLLGALEAINGILMVGVSTSVLLFVLQDAAKKAQAARRG
jgi:hypothetical protein